MEENLETRLIELESRLAYQERLTEDLSTVMADQGRILDAMTLQLRRTGERLREMEDTRDRMPPDDKPPPHY